MRKFLTSVLTLLLSVVTFEVSAWGTLGHCTIAEIAERNLTPEAKANIKVYTNGEPLSSYAMWMDQVGTDPVLGRKGATRGWHASIVDENCNTSQELRDARRKGRDSATGLLELEKILSERKNHTDSVVMFALKCVIHMVGDMHCPSHLRYTDNSNEGSFNVYFFDKKRSLHSVWDWDVIQRKYKSTGWVKFADDADSYSKKQIKRVTNGWVEDWLEDAARDIRPIVGTVSKGDYLEQEFFDTAFPLADLEIQKAGYRLAKYLNTVFK